MDGVTSTTSVVTIISLALNLSRGIYRVVSQIQNGPKVFQQIKTSSEDLSSVLQQLAGCTDQSYLDTDLKVKVERCTEDLRELEGALAKISTMATNGLVKSWKTAKFLLKQQDLEKMSTAVQRHVAPLSLQMQLIERYAIIEDSRRHIILIPALEREVYLIPLASKELKTSRAGI